MSGSVKIDRRAIKRRIRAARLKAGYKEPADLAAAIGVSDRTIERWEDQRPKHGTMPSLSEAAKLLAVLPVTLDELVGVPSDPERVVQTIATRIEGEVDGMHVMLDRLLRELHEARTALGSHRVLVDESELDVAAATGAGRRGGGEIAQ